MTQSGKVVPERSFRDENVAVCRPQHPQMALIVAAGIRNETKKLVAETIEGMREVKWPKNAGAVVSPR